MKQFFKFVFASLLALVLFFMLIFFTMIGAVAGSASQSDETEVEKNSVLRLDLSDPILEQTKENSLGILSGEANHVAGLNDILKSIKYAATDDKIKGIYIRTGVCMTGWASCKRCVPL
jgi:protease-4